MVASPRNHERHCRNAVAFTCLPNVSSLSVASDFLQARFWTTSSTVDNGWERYLLYHALFRLRSNPPIKLAISGGRLFGKWCIRDDIGKVGGRLPLDISNAEIPNDVVKGGRRLPPNDVAKAIFESVF